ncbi:MAG TPA: hypothetical protein VGV39_20410 [Mesorhizobium sp.]|jgi:hypothetical protein|uniref:hypothetical protein n=1 Tax=Mesorhizobium sp. TaxID=1871066 RepID=UPI002DDD3AED|nr:hypothetical protein [Mesorhizobium sp.]HEV2505451.1 hypothetical protein [Mesorhizobium sp.]
MKRLLTRLALSLSMAAVAQAAVAQQCDIADPARSVFDIVNQNGEKSGTAVLIDADKGLFLTALHLLGSSTLRLKQGNNQWPFRKVLAGNNSANLYDDWAIITTGQSAFPVRGIPLIYDLPPPESLRLSAVYDSMSSVGGVDSIKWNDTIQNGSACTGKGVTFLRLNDYDRGDSGSPIFSPNECGVIGLSSRFILPDDATTAQQKEVVEAFEQFSQNVPQQDRDAIAASPSLEGKASVVRELLKNELYVKIVPAKCVIDNVVQKLIEKNPTSNVSVIEDSVRADIRQIIDFLPSVDPSSARSVSDFANLVYSQDWRWPEILGLWSKYYKARSDGSLREGILFRKIRVPIEDISRRKKFYYIDVAFESALQQAGIQISSSNSQLAGVNFAGFIAVNSSWKGEVAMLDPLQSPQGDEPFAGLQLGEPSADAHSGSKRVEAGLEMLSFYKELTPEQRQNADLVKFYRDTTTQFLTSGLATLQMDVTASKDTSGKALVGLAELVNDVGTPDAPANLQKKRFEVLATKLARSAAFRLDLSAPEYVKRSNDIIEKRALFRGDFGQELRVVPLNETIQNQIRIRPQQTLPDQLLIDPARAFNPQRNLNLRQELAR